MLIPIYSPSTG